MLFMLLAAEVRRFDMQQTRTLFKLVILQKQQKLFCDDQQILIQSFREAVEVSRESVESQ